MAITLLTRRVTVLVGRPGTDELDISLDMPSPFPEMGYQGHATIQVRKGYGVQWCQEVLGVNPEVIDASAERKGLTKQGEYASEEAMDDGFPWGTNGNVAIGHEAAGKGKR